MAHDEMNTITVDKWEDEVWGVERKAEETKSKSIKLFFYFAETVWTPLLIRSGINGGTGSLGCKPY